MWQVVVLCSGCAEETEVLVEDLDDAEREVCPCGYGYLVLSVASFEPVYAEDGESAAPAPRADLPLAA